MSNNYYSSLGVDKKASKDEIKKAYRKKAMQYHPDKNTGDAAAEKKFKEINEAYQVLGDEQKRKQYDTFGSAGARGNPFAGAGGQQAGNPFGGSSGAGFGGFEDIFSQFGGNSGRNSRSGGVEFDFGDLFGSGASSTGRSQSQKAQEPETLDFEKTYEVPIFDLILGCKIEVKSVYGKTAKLKIPAGTSPGKKFRVKDFGKKEATQTGNLIVTVKALMPKQISELDRNLLERVRDNIGY